MNKKNIMKKHVKNRRRKTMAIIVGASVLLSSFISYHFGYYVGSKKARTVEINTYAIEDVLVEQDLESEIIDNSNAEHAIEEKSTDSEDVSITDDEIDLLALVVMAEAEGECEKGQRLVIDTILNRVDHHRFPNTIHDVIYQPNQFEAMWNGRVNRCYVRDGIRQLVIEEMRSRTNSEVVFFRASRYSDYGTPMFQVGNHYFSKY